MTYKTKRDEYTISQPPLRLRAARSRFIARCENTLKCEIFRVFLHKSNPKKSCFLKTGGLFCAPIFENGSPFWL